MNNQEILQVLACADAPLLGQGGEASVYALSSSRVVRIHEPGADMESAYKRKRLFEAIASCGEQLGFATPRVISVQQIGERVVSVEPRLPGEAMTKALAQAKGVARSTLLNAYLEAAVSLVQLDAQKFTQLGLKAISERFDAAEPAIGLVHVDYGFGNVLVEGERISAVLDFGPSTQIGDVRLSLWAAVAYMDAELSPSATDADRAYALEWLAQRGFLSGYGAAKIWLARYWSFAQDDAALMAWCGRVLAP